MCKIGGNLKNFGLQIDNGQSGFPLCCRHATNLNPSPHQTLAPPHSAPPPPPVAAPPGRRRPPSLPPHRRPPSLRPCPPPCSVAAPPRRRSPSLHIPAVRAPPCRRSPPPFPAPHALRTGPHDFGLRGLLYVFYPLANSFQLV